MKAKLIIANWLFAWVPLSYAGNDVIIAAIVAGWFGLACYLLNKHKKATFQEVEKFNKWIDKQTNK